MRIKSLRTIGLVLIAFCLMIGIGYTYNTSVQGKELKDREEKLQQATSKVRRSVGIMALSIVGVGIIASLKSSSIIGPVACFLVMQAGLYHHYKSRDELDEARDQLEECL